MDAIDSGTAGGGAAPPPASAGSGYWSPCAFHFAKIVLNWFWYELAAAAAVIFPCATWANICGIRDWLKMSPTAAFA